MKQATKDYIDQSYQHLAKMIGGLSARVNALEEDAKLQGKPQTSDVKKALEIAVYLEDIWKGRIHSNARALDYSRDLREIADRIAGSV